MTFSYPNITELWHGVNRSMLLATNDQVDFISSSDTVWYDRTLTAESMDFDFDAGVDLWMPRTRWTKLVRDYVNPEQLERFVDLASSIHEKEATRGVVTQMHPPSGHVGVSGKYRWGQCVHAWGYRGGKKGIPPTLIVHTRTTYIGYIGGLDLALWYHIAKRIADRIGRDVSDFQLVWKADSILHHDFKGLPYAFRYLEDPRFRRLLMDPSTDRGKWASAERPTLKKMRKSFAWLERQNEAGIPWEDEKFGPRKRVRRRYQQYLDGETLESVPLDTLTFAPIGL